MNPLHRLWWFYTGEVSRMVVEEMDETADAVIQPLASVVLAAGTVALATESASVVMQAFGALVSLAFIYLTLTSIGSAYVYATERTEVPV